MSKHNPRSYILVLKNGIPKTIKPGSQTHKGYKALQKLDGKTYEEFRKAGGTKGKRGRKFSPSSVIKHAIANGFAVLSDPPMKLSVRRWRMAIDGKVDYICPKPQRKKLTKKIFDGMREIGSTNGWFDLPPPWDHLIIEYSPVYWPTNSMMALIESDQLYPLFSLRLSWDINYDTGKLSSNCYTMLVYGNELNIAEVRHLERELVSWINQDLASGCDWHLVEDDRPIDIADYRLIPEGVAIK